MPLQQALLRLLHGHGRTKQHQPISREQPQIGLRLQAPLSAMDRLDAHLPQGQFPHPAPHSPGLIVQQHGVQPLQQLIRLQVARTLISPVEAMQEAVLAAALVLHAPDHPA